MLIKCFLQNGNLRSCGSLSLITLFYMDRSERHGSTRVIKAGLGVCYPLWFLCQLLSSGL